MPSVITRALERFGFGRKETLPSIINDGRGPSVRVVQGPYQITGAGNRMYGTGFGYGALDYYTQAFHGYSRNSDVYACVTLIAEAASSVKWWDGGGDSKSLLLREILFSAIRKDLAAFDALGCVQRAADRARALKAATNPQASVALLTRAGGAAFINQWISSLLISGDAFVEIEGTDSSVAQLHLLRTDRVRAKRKTSGTHMDEAHIVDYWEVSAYGSKRRVEVENMLHSKLFNPLDDVEGMAPLDAAMLNVLLHNEGTANLRKVLKQGAVPGWVGLDKEYDWTDEQILALREKVSAAKRGEGELTLQGATWHEMGIKPSESGYSDAQVLTKRDIASVYHVDPSLIGDTTGRTYATYRESRRGLYMEAVIPPLTLFRDDWNRVIGARIGSPLDFDRDSFDAITAAREEATDRVIKAWTAGLIDRSESRSDLNYDPIPGDEGIFYAPASFVPMNGKPEETD